MSTPLRHYDYDQILRGNYSGLDALLLLKVSSIYDLIGASGFTIPPDAQILFERDVSPLEIDIRSWYPVVVREETFDPKPDPWIRFT